MSDDATRRIAASTIDALADVVRIADGANPITSVSLSGKPIEFVVDLLHAVVAIADEIRKGLSGSVSVEQIEDSIRAITQRLTENDSRIDRAIDAKFPKDDGIPP